MRITGLELNHLGCFEERSFRFDPLTVIHGDNRTGKSTLVYALYFALYGRHLNTALKPSDLCRKGRPSGVATLDFSLDANDYRAIQSTAKLPKLFAQSNGEWTPLSPNHPDPLTELLPASAEAAALSSFFRESELLYFLQEMPKYNKTLLQTLIRMDNALILASRFKKALNRAREVRKAIADAGLKTSPDPLNLELAHRSLAAARKALADTEETLAKLLTTEADPTALRLLTQRHAEKKGARDRLARMAEGRPSEWDLERETADIRASLTELRRRLGEREGVAGELGRADAALAECREKLGRLSAVTAGAACPLCGQAVSGDHQAALVTDLSSRAEDLERRRSELAGRLADLDRTAAEAEELEKRLARSEKAGADAQAVRRRMEELDADLQTLAADISRISPDPIPSETGPAGVAEAPAGFSRRESLEREKARLRDEIVRQEVAIRQHEDQRRRAAETQAHLDVADRDMLVCRVAHQSLDRAIEGLGSEILAKVRDGVGQWMRHFGFLDRFDIQVGETELIPVIQARGYQYKLNQMSKSERIFLYLLLKLAIGEALGHLGVFVLDDPADGLDTRRKETLAHLLTEVAARRQVIVTTNDREFAGLFREAAVIRLEAETA